MRMSYEEFCCKGMSEEERAKWRENHAKELAKMREEQAHNVELDEVPHFKGFTNTGSHAADPDFCDYYVLMDGDDFVGGRD